MNNLKHELRKMFENRYHPDLLNKEKELADDLLEKIINLSVLNPSVFHLEPWRIIAVKSFKYKKKLYDISKEQQKFLDAPVTLVILSRCKEYQPDRPDFIRFEANARLLNMSITYAARHFCVNSLFMDDMDFEQIKQKFNIESDWEVVKVICLGYFNDLNTSHLPGKKQRYREVVREV